MSSSTILYKFRSGTTFEALPLPGTAARLLDVKKAIVLQKKLDATSQALEFDLSVRDATTNQDREEDDELVPTATGQQQDEKELAALMAVTDPGTSSVTSGGLRPSVGYNRPAGSGPPPPRTGGHYGPAKGHHQRPNADPELRDQQPMPKKRATGIPRTFLNLSAPPSTSGDATGVEGSNEPVARIHPNVIGFEELKTRHGGLSEHLAGTKRDLDYALKVTATMIPEHLQCAICHNVVKSAMLLPWDVEGRTTCETCIRDALTQNGFRCPLTGIEGVSPDDLLPNVGLRKAADAFVKSVMEKMDEIDQQQDDEEDEGETAGAETIEGDAADSGVLVSRKTIGRSKKDDDDPFGGGDADFGGDVFDVQAETEETIEEQSEVDDVKLTEPAPESVAESPEKSTVGDAKEENDAESMKESQDAVEQSNNANKASLSETHGPEGKPPVQKEPKPERDNAPPQNALPNRRDARRRGPPAGYAAGPAGGAAVRAQASPYPGQGRGAGPSQSGRRYDRAPYHGGRGPPPGGRFFNGGGRPDPEFGGRGRGHHHHGQYDDRGPRHGETMGEEGRGTKRPHSDTFEDPRGGRFDPRARGGFRGGRGGDFNRGGRGGRGPYRGGGRFGGRGGRY